MIDDGTVSRLDQSTYRLTSADPNLRWLSMNAVGLEVEITEVTGDVAALSLQGPNSRSVLKRVCESDVDTLKFFRLMENKLDGIPVTISRTGYTGDLGYEIWMDASDALAVWDALIAAGNDYGITPVGILAMDMARVEAGLFMIEVDYTSTSHAWIEAQKSSPFELGLGWTVSLDKPGYFVGRPALEREKREGSAWKWWDWKWSGTGWSGCSGCGPAAANPRDGGAGQFASAGRERAGGLCLYVHLVAVVEEVHRAGAFAEAVL